MKGDSHTECSSVDLPDTCVLILFIALCSAQSLEEAEEDAPTPTAVLNVHAAAAGDSTTHKYLHTVSLCVLFVCKG